MLKKRKKGIYTSLQRSIVILTIAATFLTGSSFMSIMAQEESAPAEKAITPAPKPAAEQDKKVIKDKNETKTVPEKKPEEKTTDKTEESKTDGDSVIKDARGPMPKAKMGPSCTRMFRVDFRDTDINDFLKAMSSIIDRNIIADDTVKGKITVISPKKISVCDGYAYLTSVLAVKGLAVIDDGILLKIIPVKDAVVKSPIILIGRDEIPEDYRNENTVITQVVRLYAHKPSRMAGILKRIASPQINIVDYDEVDTLIFTGGADEIYRLMKILVELDIQANKEVEATYSEHIQIYHLQHLQADKLEQTLRRVRLPETDIPVAEGQGNMPNRQPRPPQARQSNIIEVIAHKESNSIIFIGTRDEFKPVESLIRLIDVPRDQVLLEVVIVEVGQDANNSFGIDWAAGHNGTGTHGQFQSGVVGESGVPLSSGVPQILNFNSLYGFSLGFVTSGNGLAALLTANMDNRNFAIISAPQILTLDNQEAEIQVGEDIPVISGNRVTGASDQQVDLITYDYKSVGVTVKFTPHINKNGMVTLDLFQEIKSAIYSDDPTINPTLTKREVKTSVRVADGQTIVIGGLVSTRKIKTERKIPILGDIPILGYLFKRTGLVVNKTNLLVFITPHVLTNRVVADEYTGESLKRQEEEFKKLNIE